MDFIEDRLVTGRKFRTFNVVDAFSRKGLASEVDTSLPGARVVQVLDRLAETRGRPEELVLDNGPDFIGGRSTNGPMAEACGCSSSRQASRSRTRTSRASTAIPGRVSERVMVPDPGGRPADHRGVAPGL